MMESKKIHKTLLQLVRYFCVVVILLGGASASCQTEDPLIDPGSTDTLRLALYVPPTYQGELYCIEISFLGGSNPVYDSEIAATENIIELGFSNFPVGTYTVSGIIFQDTCASKHPNSERAWTATGLEPTVTVSAGNHEIVFLEFGWQ